jgi:hypothetical protein
VDELVFEVTQDADGGYVAECLGEDIFTQRTIGSSCVRTYWRRFEASSLTPSRPGESACTTCGMRL